MRGEGVGANILSSYFVLCAYIPVGHSNWLFSKESNKAYPSGADVNCRFENIKAEWIVTTEIVKYGMWSRRRGLPMEA